MFSGRESPAVWSEATFCRYDVSSEPGLRGELLASGADNSHHDPGSPAVWSEATKMKP